MKKVIINIALVLIIILIYFLQLNFFNWFTIAGVKPNLYIILVLFIGLFTSKNVGAIYGISIGLAVDLLTSQTIGITAVVLGMVGLLAGIFDKNFSKDNRLTIMFIVAATTIGTEIIIYVLNYLFLNTNVDILAFVKILSIETIYNIIISIILYPAIQTFGYYMENEYKGNKILTRYF